MGTFSSMLVVDADGLAVPNAVGQVFDPDDIVAATPLAVTDLNGIPFPGSQLVASPLGVLPPFRVATYQTVDWVSGSYRVPLPSIDQVPAGGTTGQVLAKSSSSNYEVGWIDPPSGGGSGASAFNQLTGQAVADQVPPKSVMFSTKPTGGTWPARPTNRTDILVMWIGADPSPIIVDSGTGGMLRNVDIRMVTP